MINVVRHEQRNEVLRQKEHEGVLQIVDAANRGFVKKPALDLSNRDNALVVVHFSDKVSRGG